MQLCNIALLCMHSVEEYDADEGRSEYQEEVYEHQIRVLPFTRFGKCESYWTDLVSLYVYSRAETNMKFRIRIV